MPDDIPAQPLLVEIAIEPKSKADQAWLAQKGYVLVRRGSAAKLSRCRSRRNHPVCVANHSLRLTVEITGALLALA
ncbi:hypothetical protein [Bradyrhizobium sp. 170]|uniref:hypothetical protein n=1 Tax=Bradyrhizobium sp. 170 TaxID=2782641 RepID=UPI001FFF3B4D|nr:hypothetical protein [Bradyrhizobium sp. 170]UPK03946.1 hypothetical protein IVB05_41870 [Bradyrhizobium sp. 170]